MAIVALGKIDANDDDDEEEEEEVGDFFLKKSEFVTSRTIAMFKIVYTHIKPFVI